MYDSASLIRLAILSVEQFESHDNVACRLVPDP
jgi:hypothetical protein